ncbi:YeiH family protein [Thalassobacillus pellis]|uniref:YeiH family protein n=1 Tax=Thalassobacillus pellis TaxID=748008 RepID=UPI0019600437|nr:putative sulfate exporter family transporter [Thalassobacillus pellis]MBM7554224.1 putative integral membrane protein (TIGR00698 family) [Thalassobacillus pellis]
MFIIIEKYRYWLGGIAFTAFIAAIGFLLAMLPGFSFVGPLAVSILLAIGYSHFFGYPEKIRQGVQFSGKKLLRIAIILFGLKLNMQIIFEEGLPMLVKDIAVIVFAIAITLLIAKLFRADLALALLLGVGTGVCGASAIAAVSPILKAKAEDTAISAGIISVVGTIFAIGYTIIRPFLPLDAVDYGSWAGISLHEVAHVALAAAPSGEAGLAMALIGKLGRVLLLVPLSFLFIYLMRKKSKDGSNEKIAFPWFLIGFIIMSLFGTYVLGTYIPVSEFFMESISSITTFILTMAMASLGLDVSIKTLRARAWKPMLAMTITSLLLSGATLLLF